MKDRKGIIGTLIFHFLLLLILFLGAFKTPLPLPAMMGLEIDFGTSDVGKGDIEPSVTEQVQQVETQTAPQVQAAPPVAEAVEDVPTQDFEEAPVVPVEQENPTPQPDPVEQVDPVEDQTPQEIVEQAVEQPEEVEPDEPVREVNQKAMWTGASQSASNAGHGDDDEQGNKGQEDGKQAEDIFVGKGDAAGISFDLAGRSQVALPKPIAKTQKEGKVVVEITVDRNGKVVSARAGVKGTQIFDKTLWDAAQKAALNATFNSKADAAYYQKGTITYNFKLN